MPDPLVRGPSLDWWPSPESLVGLSVLPRCTRKERCERSKEPRRFASEMKQCVRLTVHPSNISVSQYNVLVRRWDGILGPGQSSVPSKKGHSPTPLKAALVQSRAGVLKKVSLEKEEGDLSMHIGEEALCIMDRKTGKTETPKTTGRVTRGG